MLPSSLSSSCFLTQPCPGLDSDLSSSGLVFPLHHLQLMPVVPRLSCLIIPALGRHAHRHNLMLNRGVLASGIRGFAMLSSNSDAGAFNHAFVRQRFQSS